MRLPAWTWGGLHYSFSDELKNDSSESNKIKELDVNAKVVKSLVLD
jgi:hypothetical protein